MPNILIHIGFHKTGTTFLQDFLFSNNSKGFSSPWTVQSGEAIKHFVTTHPERFDPRQTRKEFLSAVEKNGTEALVNVISHEDLSGYPVLSRYYGSEVAGRLHQTFPEAKILIGVREQQSMLRSLYGQYVRQDGQWPLEMFFGTGDERPGFVPICRLDHFEYHLLVQHYIRLFGRERVLILPYELLKKDAIEFEDKIHSFTKTGGVADAVLPPANVGFGGLTLAVNRKLNRFIKRPPLWDSYKSLPLTFRAKERFCSLFDRITPIKWHKQADRTIRRFIADRANGYFCKSNRELSSLLDIDLGTLGYEV